ncbi:hypothetical protein P4S75_09330 [Anoxybacillus ayderensis]|uniref:hypothetical protein n=1 Tax=Anoxybacillus ayderensis TaxID=265546 RepID=UPI002E1FAFF3|nr:hypothetical protein [Anoxybacillus ayderensis]
MRVSNIVTSVQMSDEYNPIGVKNVFDNLDYGFYVFIDVEDIQYESKLFVKIYDNQETELVCLDFNITTPVKHDTIICHVNYKALEHLPLSSFGTWGVLVINDQNEVLASHLFVVKNIGFTYTARGVRR